MTTIRMLLALLIALVMPLATPTRALAGAAEDRASQELLWMLNQERGQRGLPGMHMREDARWIAIDHSDDMARAGRLYHNDGYFSAESFRRMDASALGENVGRGPSMRSIHDALMASETHRNNLLDARFTVVGIGVVWGGDRWYITQDFVQPRR